MHLLNEAQQKAALHKEGPCLVIAGAGSGKTRVVVERISHLLAQGVEESSIVALTFTNKAAGEMVRRIESRLNKRVLVTTFHSLGARIIRTHFLALGYTSRPTIFDEEESLKIIKNLLEEEGGKKEEAKKWRETISRKKMGQMRSGKEAFFDTLFEKYLTKMKAMDAIDFDDLLLLPLRLFGTRRDILEEYHRLWRYFLVDEYQDTNRVQIELLLHLSQKERNLFVVGDPDQSIYSWRGAEAGTMAQFADIFQDLVIVPLEENYRSTNTILRAANALIKNNQNRMEKTLWSQLGEGDPILYCRTFKEREEAAFIARQIVQRKNQGSSFSDMAIFYRTHAQSRALEDLFRTFDIPYKLVGALSFYDRSEIRDMMAFLRLLLRPHDLSAFGRIIAVPPRGIGKESVRKMVHFAEERSMPICDVAHMASNKDKELPFSLSVKARAGLEDFLQKIELLRCEMSRWPLYTLMQKIYEIFALDGYLKTFGDLYQEKRENVQEFIAKAREYSQMHPEGDLYTFLEEIALFSDPVQEEVDSVSMMSLHHAKGLEFDFVAIVGIEEGLLPHVNAYESLSSIEEERRLFYVGITRAKKKLILSSALVRFMWGSERESPPSRFLREIPSHLIKRM